MTASSINLPREERSRRVRQAVEREMSWNRDEMASPNATISAFVLHA